MLHKISHALIYLRNNIVSLFISLTLLPLIHSHFSTKQPFCTQSDSFKICIGIMFGVTKLLRPLSMKPPYITGYPH